MSEYPYNRVKAELVSRLRDLRRNTDRKQANGLPNDSFTGTLLSAGADMEQENIIMRTAGAVYAGGSGTVSFHTFPDQVPAD